MALLTNVGQAQKSGEQCHRRFLELFLCLDDDKISSDLPVWWKNHKSIVTPREVNATFRENSQTFWKAFSMGLQLGKMVSNI